MTSAPRRALVVIDAQQQYFDGVLAIQHPPREAALGRILAALDTAEAHDLPVVVVQHELPAGAPVFAAGSEAQRLHPDLEARVRPGWKRASKDRASVFAGTDVADWLREREVDTITLAGFMTNTCDLATAVAAEDLGLTAEVLSDATGAIHLANDLGAVPARQLHETLMVLLHSNWAAVATTDAWAEAVAAGTPLPRGDLGSSATQGLAAAEVAPVG